MQEGGKANKESHQQSLCATMLDCPPVVVVVVLVVVVVIVVVVVVVTFHPFFLPFVCPSYLLVCLPASQAAYLSLFLPTLNGSATKFLFSLQLARPFDR